MPDSANGVNGPNPQQLNLRGLPQLIVTLFRSRNKPVNQAADVFPSSPEQKSTAQAPGHQFASLQPRSPSTSTALDESQQQISHRFTAILETIGKNGYQTNASFGNPLKYELFSATEPLAYSSDVFQFRLALYDPAQNSHSKIKNWDLKALREHPQIRAFEAENALEVILDLFQPTDDRKGDFARRRFQLALFDMDSTLINEEVIDELARSIGVYDQVSSITERAMNDPTFDFAQSLKARAALLKGVRADVWDDLKKKVTIAEGARELIAGLREAGIVTGVISGGFTPMAEWLKAELGLDLAFANHLSTSPPTAAYPYPHLTGDLDLSHGKVIVTPDYKKATLIAEAGKRGIPMANTLAAGDGSNDLKMLAAAGLGVAWNAKPKTQEMAPMRLNGPSLAELLYLLGPDGS